MRVRNASSLTWPSKPNDKKKFEVQFSYHWLNSSGATVIFDGLRTALPHDLKPGTSVELRPVIQAPPRPGNYLLELTLVQEGKAWFPEIDADNKVSVPVIVTDGRSGSDGARDNLSSADSQDGKAKKNRKDKKKEPRTKAANDERRGGAAKQDSSWAIQVAAFPDETDAKASAVRLKDKGYDAFMLKSEVKGKSWYRVRVGHLASRAEAEKLQKQLASQERTDQSLVVANR